MKKKAIVIGAGIVGLATARALALKSFEVTVIERSGKAVGASIRNFGMVWPIGQPDGELYETALKSRQVWKQIADESGMWYEEAGSLHIAKAKEEWAVLEDLASVYRHRGYELLSRYQTLEKSKAVTEEGLIGSLSSQAEMIVNPRKAMAAIPVWLQTKLGVKFIWGKAISKIEYPKVFSGDEKWEADEVFVCSGADLETLYPEVFTSAPVTKCKLQMMRMAIQPYGERIGAALCGGLSLIHYKSFAAAQSLPQLYKKYQEDSPEYLKLGIHVMVSQNDVGELTVGDSHEYGLTPEPFDEKYINDHILSYLKSFAKFQNEEVIETWNGVYAKSTDGASWLHVSPLEGVTIINSLGGAGMTLSFGACEKLILENKNVSGL